MTAGQSFSPRFASVFLKENPVIFLKLTCLPFLRVLTADVRCSHVCECNRNVGALLPGDTASRVGYVYVHSAQRVHNTPWQPTWCFSIDLLFTRNGLGSMQIPCQRNSNAIYRLFIWYQYHDRIFNRLSRLDLSIITWEFSSRSACVKLNLGIKNTFQMFKIIINSTQ